MQLAAMSRADIPEEQRRNVGSIVAFQLGPEDAAILAEQFGGGVSPEDLMALSKYTAYVRMLIDGMPSRPFTIRTLEPDAHSRENRLPVIRRVTRHRYGQPATKVDEQITRTFAA